MRKVIQIDEQGFFVEDVILQDDEQTPDNCIEIEVPEGLYKPKWNGTEWVEGLTQEEIDAIVNAPKEPTETELLKEENESLNLAIIDIWETILG